MTEDPRCCGSGTCIIDTQGRCWCGQEWDGDKLCAPVLPQQDSQPTVTSTDTPAAAQSQAQETTAHPATLTARPPSWAR
jgi:hypothetical protein